MGKMDQKVLKQAWLDRYLKEREDYRELSLSYLELRYYYESVRPHKFSEVQYKSNEDPLVVYIARKRYLEERLEAKKKQIEEHLKLIAECIAPCSKIEQWVLRKRYIKGLSWDEILSVYKQARRSDEYTLEDIQRYHDDGIDHMKMCKAI